MNHSFSPSLSFSWFDINYFENIYLIFNPRSFLNLAGNHGCLASQCDENWSGQNCNVCNNDDVCSPLGVLGTQQICNKGPVVWADNHHGYCTINNALLSNLVQRQVVNATFQRNAITGALFAAIFINNDLQFSCTSKNCKQTFDSSKSIGYQALKLEFRLYFFNLGMRFHTMYL